MNMTNGVNNIEKTLIDWGRAQQVLPENNQLMKNNALNRLAGSLIEKPSAGVRFPWFSFAFTVFAVLTFVILFGKNAAVSNLNFKQSSSSHATGNSVKEDYTTANTGSLPLQTLPPQAIKNSASRSVSGKDAYPYYPQTVPPQEVPANDNRQFIKTDYSASVKTRNVQELVSRLQTTIRGFDGRVDSASNSSESGFLSFVVPADKLDAFKTEVKSISGGARFYTEALSSQNMLSDKRSLEDQQNQTQNTLDQLNTSLDQLNVTHAQTVASINSQLKAITKETATLQTEAAGNINYDRYQQIQARLQELQNQTNNLKSRLSNENTNYQNQLNSLSSQIRILQTDLDQLGKQTNDLLDTVATVTGTISISWISLWELIGLYLPAYWLVYIFLIAAVVAYFANRRQRFVL